MIRGLTLAAASATPAPPSTAKPRAVPQFAVGERVTVRCLPPEEAEVVRQIGAEVVVRNAEWGEWRVPATDLRRSRRPLAPPAPQACCAVGPHHGRGLCRRCYQRWQDGLKAEERRQ